MRHSGNYRAAYFGMCLVVFLLGLGNILDKSPDTSWASAPIAIATLAAFAFSVACSFSNGGE